MQQLSHVRCQRSGATGAINFYSDDYFNGCGNLFYNAVTHPSVQTISPNVVSEARRRLRCIQLLGSVFFTRTTNYCINEFDKLKKCQSEGSLQFNLCYIPLIFQAFLSNRHVLMNIKHVEMCGSYKHPCFQGQA